MGTFGTIKISYKDGNDYSTKINKLKKQMRIINMESTTPDATDTNKWLIIYGEWKYK